MAATFIFDFGNCFILCLVSFLCYYFFFKKPKNSEGCDLPPTPPSLPIIGHLHLLLSLLLHKSLHKLSSKYGPLLYLRVFNVPILLVSSASVAYEIFRAQDVNVSTRSFPTNEGSLFFGSSGFGTAPYGDYWKFIKKLITAKLLGPQALERSRGVRAGEVNRLYLNLVDKATKKESVMVSEEATKLISNNICKMLMGKSFSEYDEAEKVRGLVAETDVLAKKFFLAAILRKPLGISLFKKDLASVSSRYDEVLEKILMDYEESHKEEHIQSSEMLLDLLLEACQGGETEITRHHIKSLFVDLFVAGTDTSANSIQWTMAEIFNNPKILERLREEIDLVVGKNTRLIQETDLANLPYLQAVVKEGLRLHPPAPLVVRTFQEGCKAGGFDVPDKTTLVVNCYAIMRDPYLWEDPEEFKPERFLTSQISGDQEEVLKYIPFGSGRRGCPGSNLAYLSVGTAVGVMVQCFDWEIEGGKVNMEEARGTMTLTMAHPLKCTPLLRYLSPLPSTVM